VQYKRTMKNILIIINIAGFIGALIWLMVDSGWEPLVTSIGLVGALIAQIYNSRNSEGNVKMSQKGGKNSKNFQSKGDININAND
jgi:1,4-dihydroxy-2-naphthoate octaprenyltransferase